MTQRMKKLKMKKMTTFKIDPNNIIKQPKTYRKTPYKPQTNKCFWLDKDLIKFYENVEPCLENTCSLCGKTLEQDCEFKNDDGDFENILIGKDCRLPINLETKDG
jgi:hypothetical protein